MTKELVFRILVLQFIGLLLGLLVTLFFIGLGAPKEVGVFIIMYSMVLFNIPVGFLLFLMDY